MTDLDAMRAMLASAGLPELAPWQERLAAAMLDDRWRQVAAGDRGDAVSPRPPRDDRGA